MGEKWDCISHILERENREFQEHNSSRMEFLKTFTGVGIIPQCTARKEAKIVDHMCPWMSLIPIKTDSLPSPFSTYGLDPSLGMVQTTLSLYEREEGPMPHKVSYIGKKIITNRGSRSYSLLQQVLVFIAFIKIPKSSSTKVLFLFFILHNTETVSFMRRISNCAAKYHIVVHGLPTLWCGWVPFLNNCSLM